MKFGGTSLDGPATIHHACRIVKAKVARSPIVVVSALGKTTDRLLEAVSADSEDARETLGELRRVAIETAAALIPPEVGTEFGAFLDRVHSDASELLKRLSSRTDRLFPSADLDALLACGERISSRLFTLALRSQAMDAVHLDARELVVTESRHGGAAADFGRTRRKVRDAVLPLIENGSTPVMGGFISRDLAGVPTTLGRGGSDYTASLAGAALGVDEVQIWTDVDGVMTADPSLVESARGLPVLSLLEASELAYFGGRVLHPSTMLPAIEHGIPIHVLNSMRPHAEGTLIVQDPPESPNVVKSVVYKEGITLIDIYSTRMLMAHGFLARIFAVFERHEMPVDMVSTSEVSVSMTVDRPARVDRILADLAGFSRAEASSGKAIVCVVGEGIRYTPGIAAKVFNALEGIRIRMISLGASRVNVGFVIDEKDLEAAVIRLHETFFPSASPRKDKTVE